MTVPFTSGVSPTELRSLQAQGELAILDVREAGEFAAGHLLFASSAPLSVFEYRLSSLVPRRSCPIVLVADGADDRASFAAVLARQLGYSRVSILAGGTEAWRDSGYELFEGQFVPSKAFGELVEKAFGVPHVSPVQLRKWMQAGRKLLLLDGRPRDEHRKMNIPGSISLPNGELAYRAQRLVPDDETTIVVHCAGRTRSILGAQILRETGLPNPIYALENGTQGWSLAGFELEAGSDRSAESEEAALSASQAHAEARSRAAAWGVPLISAEMINSWAREQDRTTYLLDVRSDTEFEQAHVPGTVHAPGGQLLQSTDSWLACRGARVVLVDDTELRAVVIARWMRLMGWDCSVLAGGRSAWTSLDLPLVPQPSASTPPFRSPDWSDLPLVLDLRSSMAFRAGHIVGAEWALRPHLRSMSQRLSEAKRIGLCGSDERVVGLAAKDLRQLGCEVEWYGGDTSLWSSLGCRLDVTPAQPTDEQAIDFVYFTHDRHSGNLDAARRYLAWEMGLVARLDELDRRLFRI
jgi:rhodanese-related sulfurtransferase